MADKKAIIKDLQDLFSKKNVPEDKMNDMYTQLYKGLDKIKSLDFNYIENFEKIKGANYDEKIKYLNDFSFDNCCTLLTFLLRGERFSEGLFEGAVKNGDVLQLLERAYQVA